jgi:hypothetical protein
MAGNLHEDQCMFLSYLAQFFLEWEIFQASGVVKTKHILYIQQSCRLWDHVKNIVQPSRPLMTIELMCIVCWITKATDTHSECVILTAFPLQTMVARTCHSVASTVHCRPFFVDNGNEIVWILHNIFRVRASSMESRRCK